MYEEMVQKPDVYGVLLGIVDVKSVLGSANVKPRCICEAF
jgi:hypothetical protein